MDETNNQSPLPAGTELEQYKIIKSLGEGGFGITYLATDQNENRPVVIKEYFPFHLAMRSKNQSQLSLLTSDKRNDFSEGLARFKREALTLGDFSHPNIVKVQTYFEKNDTAYFVMEYIEGQSLGDYQSGIGRALTQSEIESHLLPVLKGLAAVHDNKLLHLDIKPDNILKTTYGEPLLIDFGGARFDSAKASQDIGQHTSMVATKGFAPPEQYSTVADQTAATDLYAFGMTLYSVMAPDEELPESKDRQTLVFEGLPDPLKPIRTIATGYDERLYQVVDACVKLKQKDRPSSVADLQGMLGTVKQKRRKATNPKQAKQSTEPSESKAQGYFKKGERFYNDENFAEALKWFKKAGALGHELAQVNLGYMYEGNGIKQDYSKAVEWYERAAKKGNYSAKVALETISNIINEKSQDPESCFKVGQNYFENANYVEALKWYEWAAHQGHELAQVNLGYMYEGNGIKADKAKAVEWYEKAAQQGNYSAKLALEHLTNKKDEDSKSNQQTDAKTKEDPKTEIDNWADKAHEYYLAENFESAFKWYEKAAIKGHVESQFYIGYMYEHGKGVTQSESDAITWYRIAADRGELSAQSALSRLLKQNQANHQTDYQSSGTEQSAHQTQTKEEKQKKYPYLNTQSW